MKTCVSLIKAVTSNKDLSAALESVTTNMKIIQSDRLTDWDLWI